MGAAGGKVVLGVGVGVGVVSTARSIRRVVVGSMDSRRSRSSIRRRGSRRTRRRSRVRIRILSSRSIRLRTRRRVGVGGMGSRIPIKGRAEALGPAASGGVLLGGAVAGVVEGGEGGCGGVYGADDLV